MGAAVDAQRRFAQDADLARVQDFDAQLTEANLAIRKQVELSDEETSLGKDFKSQQIEAFQKAYQGLVNGADGKPGLATDAQRKAAARVYLQARTSLSGFIDGDTIRKQQSYERRAAIAVQGTSEAMSISAYLSGDEKAYLDARSKAAAAVAVEAKGQGDAVLEAKTVASNTRIGMAIIGELAARDRFDEAQKYLDAHRSTMSPEAIIGLEGKVQAAGVRVRGQAEADRIAALTVDVGGKAKPVQDGPYFFNYELALAEARKITDPALRDETEQRLAHRLQQTDAARRAHDTPLVHSAVADIQIGRVFTLADARYTDATVEGKQAIAGALEARRRSSRTASADDRREQALANGDAIASFQALDPVGRPGQDQQTVDVTAFAKTYGADDRTVARLEAMQGGIARAVTSKSLVKHEAWNERVRAVLDAMPAFQTQGKSKSEADKVRLRRAEAEAFATEQYNAWLTENPGRGAMDPGAANETLRQMAVAYANWDVFKAGRADGSIVVKPLSRDAGPVRGPRRNATGDGPLPTDNPMEGLGSPAAAPVPSPAAAPPPPKTTRVTDGKGTFARLPDGVPMPAGWRKAE